MGPQRAESITAPDQETNSFKSRLKTLTEENESLRRHSLKHSDELSTLRLETAAVSNHQLTAKMLCYQMSTYPPLLDYVDNNLLCSPPTSTTDELKENARHLLRLIHPDKNPTVSPAVAKLVPTITEAPNILIDKTQQDLPVLWDPRYPTCAKQPKDLHGLRPVCPRMAVLLVAWTQPPREGVV